MSRDDTIRGLRELADFLDTHPDLPVHAARINFSVDIDHARGGRRAEVDRIAAILGVEPRDGVHYVAERWFGCVEYAAFSCDPEPGHGLCAVCRENQVRTPGAEGLAGKLCTPCLGDQADVIDPQGGAS